MPSAALMAVRRETPRASAIAIESNVESSKGQLRKKECERDSTGANSLNMNFLGIVSARRASAWVGFFRDVKPASNEVPKRVIDFGDTFDAEPVEHVQNLVAMTFVMERKV